MTTRNAGTIAAVPPHLGLRTSLWRDVRPHSTRMTAEHPIYLSHRRLVILIGNNRLNPRSNATTSAAENISRFCGKLCVEYDYLQS